MRTELAAPYLDAAAADLCWELAWSADRRDALSVHEIQIAGVKVELRVLGASHQVLIEGRASLAETVACLPGRPASLPALVSREQDGLKYEFSAQVDTPADFDAKVRAVRDEAADDPNGIVGVFAGSDSAVTAIRASAAPGGVRWHTWHAYPQRGELVVTHSLVTRS